MNPKDNTPLIGTAGILSIIAAILYSIALLGEHNLSKREASEFVRYEEPEERTQTDWEYCQDLDNSGTDFCQMIIKGDRGF